MKIYSFQFLLESDSILVSWIISTILLGIIILSYSIYKNRPALWRTIFKIVPCAMPALIGIPVMPLIANAFLQDFGNVAYAFAWSFILSIYFLLYMLPFNEGFYTRAKVLNKES